jgi:DNA topoisomerase-1
MSNLGTGTIRVFAGDCTTTFEGERDRTQRGRVVVVVKPDRTTLVHDADGYQPVAWLTRPDSLTVEADDAGFGLVARAGDQVLRVVSNRNARRAAYAVSEAGVPVGSDPETEEPLVRAGGDVVGIDSDVRYPLPAGASVTDESCASCGLPTIRAAAGERFEVCLDRSCASLDDAVRDRFDREWTCPECGAALRIIRRGGRLLAGCDASPDCETAFAIPAGVVDGECPCGLPTFETSRGRRCLDGTCERFDAAATGPGA